MKRPLTILGAPTSAGAYAPGQEKAPALFRSTGLLQRLRSEGRRAVDVGDTPPFRWRPDLRNPNRMNLPAVRDAAIAVAEKVAHAMDQGHDILVLGGDCTIELGTVAGAQSDGARVGLIYIDLDLDLNTLETSDGALDWTGVAHMLDIPGCASELASVGHRRPLLTPESVLFFAADNITPSEADTVRRLGLPLLRLAQVQTDPVGAARQALAWGRGFDRLLIHLDVDVLEYVDFPIAENVRRDPGMKFDELSIVLPVLLSAENGRALTVTEVNPDHAPDADASFSALNNLLATALGAKDQPQDE